MKKTIFIAGIAEKDSNGDMYSCLIHADSEKALVSKVNAFFDEEEAEGHSVCEEDGETPLRFSGLSEINGCNIMDIDRDREYSLSAEKIEL